MAKPRKSRSGKVRSGSKARSVQSAAPEFNEASARFLPLAGFVALVFAWVAMLGGVAAGEVNIYSVFDFDTVRPWLTFRDAFIAEALPVHGWRLGTAPNYIPDMALSWAIFAAGAGPVAGIWLYTLAQPLLAAAGWVLVCDRLFGKSPARRTAVLLAHALCLLLLAWNPPGVFLIWAMSVYHSGTWALMPWALMLLLMALGDNAVKKSPPPENTHIINIILVFMFGDCQRPFVSALVCRAGACRFALPACAWANARGGVWNLRRRLNCVRSAGARLAFRHRL